MIPGKFDLPCPRGGTLDIGITGKDELDRDINFETDYDSCRLEVRPTWDKLPGRQAPNPLLELTTSNGGLVASGLTLTITDTAAATLLYTFSNAEYELELINDGPPEVVSKFLYGKFIVGNDI